MCEDFCKILGFVFLLLLSLIIFIGVPIIFNIHDREKQHIWQQAVDRGYAKKVETSSDTHYIWIEK